MYDEDAGGVDGIELCTPLHCAALIAPPLLLQIDANTNCWSSGGVPDSLMALQVGAVEAT